MQTLDLGNGELAFNILCQNLLSEIQGDGNAVNIIGLQTGGERTPSEPQTCEECFTAVLTDGEINDLEAEIRSDLRIPSLQDWCQFLEESAQQEQAIETITEELLQIGVDQPRIDKIVDCLERILGLES